MHFDPVLLSRIQFAWVIAWHILLPAFTVGAASFIAVVEGLGLATGREVYVRISIFWTKIFAIAFGMGVVTGLIMPFQFGTNWSRYASAGANILAPLFAYEGLTAFFLEAGFLGVLLFGRKLVPPWAHFFAALMMAIGTLLSSFWILSANSWMQTPGRLRDHQWPVLLERLDRSDFQSVVSLSARAHGGRILHDNRIRSSRCRRIPVEAQSIRPRSAHHDVHGAVDADRVGALADGDRRYTRPQHPQISACKARGD
jgi:hypothetical protein